MAKAKTTKTEAAALNTDLLKAIASATAANSFMYVSKEDGMPLLATNPPLIEVNTSMLDPNDANKAAARITLAGTNLLKGLTQVNTQATPAGPAETFEILSGIALPPSKRGNKLGGGGAPTKYPFDKLEVGQTFFVPVSAKHPDPVKSMGSTVSAAHARFAQKTGEVETVVRSKRGEKNKVELDANGQKIMIEKTREKMRFTRRFAIRAIEAGKVYGEWTAPANGAVIQRTE